MPAQSTKRSARNRRVPRDATQEAVGKFAGDAYSLARRSIAGLNQLRRLINIETKRAIIEQNLNPITTPAIACLSSLAQGLTDGARVGNSIRLQHLSFQAQLQLNLNYTNPCFVRVLIVRDNENSGSAPTATQILGDPAAQYNVISQLNYLSKKRFAVLYDTTQFLDLRGPTGSVLMYNAAHPGHINFRGTDGTDASMAEGSIWLLICSTTDTNSPGLRFRWTIDYTDD
jgi:hypothetical protein